MYVTMGIDTRYVISVYKYMVYGYVVVFVQASDRRDQPVERTTAI